MKYCRNGANEISTVVGGDWSESGRNARERMRDCRSKNRKLSAGISVTRGHVGVCRHAGTIFSPESRDESLFSVRVRARKGRQRGKCTLHWARPDARRDWGHRKNSRRVKHVSRGPFVEIYFDRAAIAVLRETRGGGSARNDDDGGDRGW